MNHPPIHEAPVYPVDPASNVTLTIIIGEAQLGISGAWLDATFMRKGDFTKQVIGKGAALAGKALRLRTMVADVNAFTNRMAVTYILEGGKKTYRETLKWEVAQDGDPASFRIAIPIA